MNNSLDLFEDPTEGDAFNTYTVLKVKFFAQDRKIYGILLMFYSPQLDYCEKSFLTLTTYSLDYNALGTNSSFEEFYKAIYNKMKEGISFQNINFKIKSALENDFSIVDTASRISKIKDTIEIEQDLKGILKKTMSDKRITTFTFLERINRESYNTFFKIDHSTGTANGTSASTSLSDSPEVDINKEINIPPQATLTSASLILAPLEGKPISDLRQGHLIFISINPISTDVSSSTDLDKKKENIKRVPITGNFYYEGVHHLGVQIQENEYAVISEDANVKVKTSELKKETSTTPSAAVKKTRTRSRMLILGFLLAIIFLTLILFLSFIWLL